MANTHLTISFTEEERAEIKARMESSMVDMRKKIEEHRAGLAKMREERLAAAMKQLEEQKSMKDPVKSTEEETEASHV